MQYGCDSMVSPIKSIMLKHPREAFVSQTYLEEVWQDFSDSFSDGPIVLPSASGP